MSTEKIRGTCETFGIWGLSLALVASTPCGLDRTNSIPSHTFSLSNWRAWKSWIVDTWAPGRWTIEDMHGCANNLVLISGRMDTEIPDTCWYLYRVLPPDTDGRVFRSYGVSHELILAKQHLQSAACTEPAPQAGARCVFPLHQQVPNLLWMCCI